MKKFYSLFAILLLMAVSATVQAATVSIGAVKIENMGMNKRMVRINDNGIFLDNTGMCVEVSVNINAKGLAGKRVICSVNPLDGEGNVLGDKLGEAVSLGAINIPTDNFTGKVVIPLPYEWVYTESNRKGINLGVAASCFGMENVEEAKAVVLSDADIKIDRSKLANKMMGDMLGGDPMGMLIGGLFDTSDAESTETCPSCEGTGVCPHCDGDAYLDPAECRKCASDPGICRRCKGEGTITIKYDIY